MPRVVDVRAAERLWFDALGLDPIERFVDLARVGCRTRILETGAGPPVLFVHGTMTAGASWASLAARLPGFRCLLLDRPGCGGSTLPEPPPLTLAAQRRVADDLVADVLDGLELATSDVVTTSLGGWYGFRSAAAHPTRVRRMVGIGYQVGAPIERAPLVMRMRLPIWSAGRLPMTRGMLRRVLAAAGMRHAFEAGLIDDLMLAWMHALLTGTDTMRNELLTSPAPIGLRGPDAAVEHHPVLLARVTAPTLLLWGTDDPFGGVASARTFARRIPEAIVQMVDGAGHAPWLDEPELVAGAVRRHFRGGTGP